MLKILVTTMWPRIKISRKVNFHDLLLIERMIFQIMERISKEIKLYSRKILLRILPQRRFSFEVEPSSDCFQVRKVKTE